MVNKFMKNVLVITVVLVISSAIPSRAENDIKGKVSVSQASKSGGGGGLGALYKKSGRQTGGGSDGVEVVIYLKDFPGAPEAAPVSGVELSQNKLNFDPHVIAVPKGSTVSFPNRDKVYHNVFSLTKGNSFDLGRYSRGKSKDHVFNRPGIVEVFCEIHSYMTAFIVVVPNKYYAKTDAQGNYIIKDVPPGNYTLVAWQESSPLQEINITVPESGDLDLNIDF